jgi:hypothetical protein
MNWNPLDGEIPPDLPWCFEPGDSPAEIIRAMREAWGLAKGGTPEHAQALFDKARQWLDYWRQARASADDLDRAGIHLQEAPNARIPDGAVAQTAILAIYAAHQAILTGRRALWGIALELRREVQPAGDAIKRKVWSKTGGESRKGKRGPLRLAIEELSKRMGTRDFDQGLAEIRKDAEDDSDLMDDLRERRTVPVTVRFQEVDDVEEKVRFLVAGRELVSCPVDNFT